MLDLNSDLADESRLLMQARLRPLQGTRFQPTGFPDLGAAVYETPEWRDLLVESPQSMANRMEEVTWDRSEDDVIPPLDGISYIRVEQDGEFLTSSILEAHRLNSPYILESGDESFFETLREEVNVMEKRPVDLGLFARIVMKYDCNSLLHGVFLAKDKLAGGRLRVPRSVSAFIEAHGVRVATSGGVKKDEVDPQGDTQKGFGHVPFARDEYTADEIIAYFNMDLSQVRAYGLSEAATDLLLTLGLYKVRRFLEHGLRLRTACDLEPVDDVNVTRPEGWPLPHLDTLEEQLPGVIEAAAEAGLFAEPPVTTVSYVAN